jgi:uncharacterized membrane-anchored protein
MLYPGTKKLNEYYCQFFPDGKITVNDDLQQKFLELDVEGRKTLLRNACAIMLTKRKLQNGDVEQAEELTQQLEQSSSFNPSQQ